MLSTFPRWASSLGTFPEPLNVDPEGECVPSSFPGAALGRRDGGCLFSLGRPDSCLLSTLGSACPHPSGWSVEQIPTWSYPHEGFPGPCPGHLGPGPRYSFYEAVRRLGLPTVPVFFVPRSQSSCFVTLETPQPLFLHP